MLECKGERVTYDPATRTVLKLKDRGPNMGKSPAQKLSWSYRSKRSVVSASLLVSGVAFELVSKHSPELKAEIADWEDGRVFSLGVLPDGPAISLKKEGDRIRYLGKGYKNPKLKLLFKNIDCAHLMMTGKIGSSAAFAQHRTILHGNLLEAMQTSRAMAIVQSYLLPGPVLKKSMKRAPKPTMAQRLLKARIMATLGIAVLVNMRK